MYIKKFFTVILGFFLLLIILVPSGFVLAQAGGNLGGGSTTGGSLNTGSSLPFCPGDTQSIGGILNFFTCLLFQSVVPLLISIAIVVFIWGVIQYVINTDDVSKRAEGRNFMIYGIIGLFVIVSIWGLIKILTGTFGINFAIPQLQQ